MTSAGASKPAAKGASIVSMPVSMRRAVWTGRGMRRAAGMGPGAWERGPLVQVFAFTPYAAVGRPAEPAVAPVDGAADGGGEGP